ncbi:hypothetical protein O0I10_008794 [Lichtheimia ornata]|uniref:F-box domain-containing protein n=1 Tax=Lichtheimia ornata TaxID=688661 RepID=A0AAD7XWG5_9FUNG|nr:uncharacterized protein O0I10_008794 [Lichtheimia ornata]KAJ8655508.1 hypothetical protein O0I10_008794 [Lichtheimia ornata]
MDPFRVFPYEVMMMIINELNLTTLRALQLMGVSRYWRDHMPNWTQRQQRVMHLSGGHLLHALPLVHTGRQLLDIIVDAPDHPYTSLGLELVLRAVQQLRLPTMLSLTLPWVRGSLPHALNVFPSNATRFVQQLSLFLVQTQVDLFHLMVHFPALTSLTLVWPIGQSPQAQFVVPANFAQPLVLEWLAYLNIQGTLP